ncbi:MAG: hypothetical protein K6T90_19345 [Leptolyngbyaceae cyanobacterium HOT.MB2.61]|nr:hypothetical protein [Leptolyngbyaceae cyanobacterium HOT.MB2.61]
MSAVHGAVRSVSVVVARGIKQMADEEHLALLKQGVTAWNKWWQNHPKSKPDLEGVKLKEANLREVNFFKELL